VSALVTGLEAVAALAWSVLLAISFMRSHRDLSVPSALGLVAVFAVLGVGLAVSAAALWRGRRRPRAFAVVMHALVTLIGFSTVAASPWFGSAFVVAGGAGLATLFANPTSRALGRGRLPGS